jgi:protein tyrosine phosphatase
MGNLDCYKYIATQAPLKRTFADFWQMCWEQKIGSIIMLVNLNDKKKVRNACLNFYLLTVS